MHNYTNKQNRHANCRRERCDTKENTSLLVADDTSRHTRSRSLHCESLGLRATDAKQVSFFFNEQITLVKDQKQVA